MKMNSVNVRGGSEEKTTENASQCVNAYVDMMKRVFGW